MKWLCLSLLPGIVLTCQVAHAAEPPSQAVAGASSTLRIGYRLDAAPFSFKTSNGQPSGYTVDLCRRIVEEIRVIKGQFDVEYLPLTAAERGGAILDGGINMLCGADTVTLSRRKLASFSIPIFMGGIGALVRDDAPRSLHDVLEQKEPEFRARYRRSFADVLRQKTFTVVKGSLAETWLKEELDEFSIEAETTTADSYAGGIKQVLAGEADVFFADRAILLDAAHSSVDADRLEVVDRRYTDEPIAIAMRRGDEDLRLLVDTVLSRLYRSGEITGIYSKYFGAPDDEALITFRLGALPE